MRDCPVSKLPGFFGIILMRLGYDLNKNRGGEENFILDMVFHLFSIIKYLFFILDNIIVISTSLIIKTHPAV